MPDIEVLAELLEEIESIDARGELTAATFARILREAHEVAGDDALAPIWDYRPSGAHPWIDWEPAAIAVRIRAFLRPFGVVEVRIGDEVNGLRNVGVDLPRARRSRLESQNLLVDTSRALEKVGVTMAPHALAPRVEGQLRGSVRTRAPGPWTDKLASTAPRVVGDRQKHGELEALRRVAKK